MAKEPVTQAPLHTIPMSITTSSEAGFLGQAACGTGNWGQKEMSADSLFEIDKLSSSASLGSKIVIIWYSNIKLYIIIYNINILL